MDNSHKKLIDESGNILHPKTITDAVIFDDNKTLTQKIGDHTNLETSSKTLKGAINEIFENLEDFQVKHRHYFSNIKDYYPIRIENKIFYPELKYQNGEVYITNFNEWTNYIASIGGNVENCKVFLVKKRNTVYRKSYGHKRRCRSIFGPNPELLFSVMNPNMGWWYLQNEYSAFTPTSDGLITDLIDAIESIQISKQDYEGYPRTEDKHHYLYYGIVCGYITNGRHVILNDRRDYRDTVTERSKQTIRVEFDDNRDIVDIVQDSTYLYKEEEIEQ